MPRYCKLSRQAVLGDASIASWPFLDFLLPAWHDAKSSHVQQRRRTLSTRGYNAQLTSLFYSSLASASQCSRHAVPQPQRSPRQDQKRRVHTSIAEGRTAARNHQRFDSQGRLIIETTPERQPGFSYDELKYHNFFNQNERRFAEASKLPQSFFSDVDYIRKLAPMISTPMTVEKSSPAVEVDPRSQSPESSSVEEQMKLLRSVRDLETKLAKAKEALKTSIIDPPTSKISVANHRTLTKKDYLNLVDLYFYSHNRRFSPESSDRSPNPAFLNEYSFTLSEDFSDWEKPEREDDAPNDYVSPLEEIEAQLRNNQLREVVVMRVFVDLLLDDDSSNRALYDAYQQLPQPGVAYLPKGVLRLFLQRMSTPWVKTQASKLRYLALIDDMQRAKLPITISEWSSAIYLAGRAHSRIELGEVGQAFAVWRQMEEQAGVESSDVTFNILFDIAARSGKFALAETILTEMHKRNLRLNRLGRVSLMYYHGLRGDGDGVRKAYHDFVEAGEIVDTLVLNCVLGSLINANEPTAAEQIYQRMKDMQATFKKGRVDGGEALFKLHPGPGSNKIGEQMAANELGRVLLRAPNLKKIVPHAHDQLQAQMPLKPNFTTFRTMLTYHASTSGDLDRITVLLKEMLEDFDIPLFPVVFQLLFKGFAIHNQRGGPNSTWTKHRLHMTWDACRNAIKSSNNLHKTGKIRNNSNRQSDEPLLPSMQDINIGMSAVNEASDTGQPKARTLSMWEELVVDLAAFPRERLRRLHRYHNAQFDEEQLPTSGFDSPFFQKTYYDAPQPDLDDEEGEYTLPDPLRSTIANPRYNRVNPYFDEDNGPSPDLPPSVSETFDPMSEPEHHDTRPTAPTESAGHHFTSFSAFASPSSKPEPQDEYRMRASKPMVCWLLRAYSRVTGDRRQVEEIWNSVRSIWQPRDEVERQVVVKVLLRCLRDCDRIGGGGR